MIPSATPDDSAVLLQPWVMRLGSVIAGRLE